MRNPLARILGQICGAATANFLSESQMRKAVDEELARLSEALRLEYRAACKGNRNHAERDRNLTPLFTRMRRIQELQFQARHDPETVYNLLFE